MPAHPTTIDEVSQCVLDHPHVLPRGANTKPALSRTNADVTPLDLTAVRGVSAYDPGEFTITALAGTTLQEIAQTLNEHGQWLPFDPPLADAGATIGGTVAAGLSGPGRLRFGGVRDFLVGVRFIDGQGKLVRGGGTVVKNAAGFDLPKLMIGSLGRLGILVELSFKVFPKPESFTTLRVDAPDLDAAIDLICRLTSEPWDLHALDLEPPATLYLRLAGEPASLPQRIARLSDTIDHPAAALTDVDGPTWWDDANAFTWAPADTALVKVPLTPKRIAALDAHLESAGATRRYAAAGNVAWIAWPSAAPLDGLDQHLSADQLSGLVIRGDAQRIRLGVDPARPFMQRVKTALDPTHRFPDFS